MIGQRTAPENGFAALQRLARRPAAEERCELCGAAVSPEHEHLLAVDKRWLVCACQSCAILFSGNIGQRYKRLPSRMRSLPEFHLTEAQWDSLLVPINLAFFYRRGASGNVVAAYPSPAGATESQVALETWREIAAENPVLDSMEPDVEALLINRLGAQRGFPVNQYFLLPIDRCFKLVGLVRSHWRGLSGGSELWQELQRFFDALGDPHA